MSHLLLLEERLSMRHFVSRLQPLLLLLLSISECTLRRWTTPVNPSFVIETLTDLTRSKPELIAENAFLRQQLLILHRRVKHSQLNRSDRFWLLVLASRFAHWKQALVIIQPETLFR
jgi:hypothetical protein